uniref:Uncharacterized protein n=1 Tax=Arundo donax TaxID=35708 RepID=A0A0A9FI97_ARUDO
MKHQGLDMLQLRKAAATGFMAWRCIRWAVGGPVCCGCAAGGPDWGARYAPRYCCAAAVAR